MPQVPVYNIDGKQVDTIDLNERIFAAPMKEVAVHQAAVRQLANQRQGTASTKTRAAVAGLSMAALASRLLPLQQRDAVLVRFPRQRRSGEFRDRQLSAVEDLAALLQVTAELKTHCGK